MITSVKFRDISEEQWLNECSRAREATELGESAWPKLRGTFIRIDTLTCQDASCGVKCWMSYSEDKVKIEAQIGFQTGAWICAHQIEVD